MAETQSLIVKPFLRWAGGKTWLSKNFDQYLPNQFSNYHEPFLGGASVFFNLTNRSALKNKSFLSDTNSDLINSYKILRDESLLLIKELKKYKNTEEEYYKVRGKIQSDPIKAASRFIFLNRTSFNGIYRENLNGVYNVPYGHKKYKTLFDFENLGKLSTLLQDVRITSCDFSKAISKVKKNDLVFLDPPYTVAHENNGFVKYNQKIFSWDDQIKLRNSVREIDERGAFYIMTNAYHLSIRKLYEGVGRFERLERFSVVGGLNAKREKYHEIIITNVKI